MIGVAIALLVAAGVVTLALVVVFLLAEEIKAGHAAAFRVLARLAAVLVCAGLLLVLAQAAIQVLGVVP